MNTKARILLIEDDTRTRQNMLTILRMEGFEALEAKHGAEGLEVARREKPDLILCDISMPILDGHGVLQAVRADATTQAIPFLFLTARGDKTDVRSGMNLGADDYLVKPVSVRDLVPAIEARLKRKNQTQPPLPEKREPKPEILGELGLTPREAEVLFWVAQGKTNPEMCVLLDLQLTTVKKHLESVFLKLGVENRTAAAAVALEKLGSA